MIKHIKQPSFIKAAGKGQKIIKEYFGAVNTGNKDISIAFMESHEGWEEPGQKPAFDEYTLVIKGALKVKTKENEYKVNTGEAILISKNEWVKYSSPYVGGAKYIAICLPAFSPETVNKDSEL